MIHYNSPENQKERANVVPLSMDELEFITQVMNIEFKYAKEISIAQRLIWDYENLQHMRETAPVWISVNDRLPEPKTSVLVCTDAGVKPSYFDIHKNFYSGFDILTKSVTHWQPLPQSPTK